MSRRRTGSLATHVATAKRLLESLEEQAASALGALEHEGGAGFAGALDERNRILGQLTEVVDAIAQQGGTEAAQDEGLQPMLAEMARAAAAALESQQLLTTQASRERNRLAVVLHNTNRRDTVAQQYAAATGGSPRRATLSVSG